MKFETLLKCQKEKTSLQVNGILHLSETVKEKLLGTKQDTWLEDLNKNEVLTTIKHSPTVKMVTLRVLLSSAVQNEMKLKQLDIKTAYLNAGIEEEIFVDQPPAFVKKNANGKSYVCRLKKITLWIEAVRSQLVQYT